MPWEPMEMYIKITSNLTFHLSQEPGLVGIPETPTGPRRPEPTI